MSMPRIKFIKIFYAARSELAPAFGRANVNDQTVYVRQDLPGCVRANVLCHELYHVHDRAEGYLKREIRANLYAARHFPLGFVIGTVMTLFSKERLRFYFNLIKSNL